MKHIQWKPRHCRLTVERTERKPDGEIVTEQHIYTTERVLITIPIGTLQATLETLWQPPLPLDKLDAIESFEMRAATKAFFFFDRCFWDEENLVYMAHVGRMARWWTPYYGLKERNGQYCIV